MIKETTDTPAVPGASPQKQALLEAFDSVLKKQAEERAAELREAEARRRSRTRVRPSVWALSAVVMFLCAYLYVEQPEWLFPAAAPESVAVQEASLRIGMANVITMAKPENMAPATTYGGISVTCQPGTRETAKSRPTMLCTDTTNGVARPANSK